MNWETLDVVCSGKSSIDAKNYLSEVNDKTQVADFLYGYGFDVNNPIEAAELFGIFQEAIQFIKRYFLKEGNTEGLDLSVPTYLYTITNITDVFLSATNNGPKKLSNEEFLWAGVVLKVMHTILHADKDLRSGYYSTIQKQILDRFYKHLHRDEENKLSLKNDKGINIPLYDFQTKAKKSRDSIIIKLLHKREIVAEELFDRIGVRFITYNRLDALRVIKFLYTNYVVIINNIKPSRSQNSLVDLKLVKRKMHTVFKNAMRNKWPEEQFYLEMQKIVEECVPTSEDNGKLNQHSLNEYRAIHFTGRHLVKWRNPFVQQFNEARKLALQNADSDLATKILNMDTSAISRDVRFFYPFEVQITDVDSHIKNTQGEASHLEYKKSQVKSAMKRIFKPLIELKNLSV